MYLPSSMRRVCRSVATVPRPLCDHATKTSGHSVGPLARHRWLCTPVSKNRPLVPCRQFSSSSTSENTTRDVASKFMSASAYLPHPDKVATGGEDAHFMSACARVVAVADGVGGWRDMGIDSGLFSRELVRLAQSYVADSGNTEPYPALVYAFEHVTFGSCAMQHLPHPFWDTIANLRPNLFIFGGDNVYGDNNGGTWMPACSDSSCQVLDEAYHELEKKPSFTGFRAKYPILAVWDDHDFGVNDGGASFPYKRSSQAIFKKFFEIDDKRNKDPRRGRDGVYGAWWYGVDTRRVHIVVLDCRFFKSDWALRDPKQTYSKKGSYLPSTSPEKTMLGEVQWSWFEQELSQRSEVCLIVSSIQVISTATEYENWGLFPDERLRALSMLENSACGAVLILSGDRHVGGIYRRGTLVEVTSSSLTHTMKYISEVDPSRLHPLVDVNNFGVLSFHWEQKTVVATLREGEGRRAGSVIQTVNTTFR